MHGRASDGAPKPSAASRLDVGSLTVVTYAGVYDPEERYPARVQRKCVTPANECVRRLSAG
jgi:hypothetical protein